MRSFRCADQGGRPPSLEESSVVSFIATVNRKPELSLYIFGGRVIDGQKLLRVRSLVREDEWTKENGTHKGGRSN